MGKGATSYLSNIKRKISTTSNVTVALTNIIKMPSNSLGNFIHRISGVYRDPQRVLGDAEILLSSPLGAHLKPTTEPLMLNDGSSTPPVLLLRGTLPMTYRQVTYNVPIDVYLPPAYPLRPPTVFVRPVASMAIKKNHKHVGLDGRVYLPYLHEWRPGTHDLRELAVWMSSLFGEEPPVYAKSAAEMAVGNNGTNNGHGHGHGGHHHPVNPPPPYPPRPPHSTTDSSSAGHSHASSGAGSGWGGGATSSHSPPVQTANNTNAAEQARRREQLERDVSEANRIADIAREADAAEARSEAEAQRRQREYHQKMSGARATATSKAQHAMQIKFRGMKEELKVELTDQKRLEYGKTEIEALMTEGEGRKRELQKGKEELDEAIDELETWLAAAKEQQQSAENGEGNNDDECAKVDLVALPADTPSAQMLALSAENAAIDDCVYFLDCALVRGNITMEVFLKEVRRLSKRQFLVKAHLIKIAQTRAIGHG